MSTRIFIDGEAGTTGLQIRQRLQEIKGVELLNIAPQQRKDVQAKRDLIAQADGVVLCLHDDAARESVALIDAMQAQGQAAVRIVDASTAHRISQDWVYGFAELCAGQRQAIASAQRVSNPGCHATAAVALLRPLIDAGLIASDQAICLSSASGYSGGGRALMDSYESGQGAPHELYGLGLEHKHVPEIMRWSGLQRRPLFTPSVGNFAQGMLVQLPLHHHTLPRPAKTADFLDALNAHYAGSEWVRVLDGRASARLNAVSLVNQDGMELHVFGNDNAGHTLLVARLDNLGKGASGAAVQNLRLMFKF